MLYVNPLATRDLSHTGDMAKDPVRRKQALEELEHYFLYMLMEEMQKTVPESEMFGSGQAQQVWKDMMNDALAGAMAKSGQMGLAKEMDRQLAIQDLAIAPGELPSRIEIRPMDDARPRRILPADTPGDTAGQRLDLNV